MNQTYTLADLEVAFGGRDRLEALLKPFHELRADGIWVTEDARLDSWRETVSWTDEPVPMDHLLIVGEQSVNKAVMPVPFTARDLARFLSVRTGIAMSLENQFCNNKPGVPKWLAQRDDKGFRLPNPEFDTPPFPFDEEALNKLSEKDAGVAAGLVRAALDLLWRGDLQFESAATRNKTLAMPTPSYGLARGTRGDQLTPLIEKALKELGAEADTATVFELLRTWASEKRSPLQGVDPDGIQWVDSNDELCNLSKDALDKRLRRRKPPLSTGNRR